jgi:DNA-binding PadR family transcriptional regulator
MDPVKILALASRHYLILTYLKSKPWYVAKLQKEIEKKEKMPRSTLDAHLDEMVEAGLVEKKKVKQRSLASVTNDGIITLDYINKFNAFIFRPSLNVELKSAINGILNYYKTDHTNPKVEEILFIKLFDLCRSNPESLFSKELQNFLEKYANNLPPSIEIENMILHFLNNILQNVELKDWFYSKIYPIIISQSTDKGKPDSIRNARIQLAWSFFRLDETKRD